MNEKLKEIFIKQMILPKEELAMQTMELLADKMDLQSKIDKAIEYINYHDVIYNNGYIDEKHKFDKSINPKELLDILKEDK